MFKSLFGKSGLDNAKVKDFYISNLARLQKEKETFLAANYDISALKTGLTGETQIALITECDSIPAIDKKSRYPVIGKSEAVADVPQGQQKAPPTPPLSEYACWTSRAWNKDCIAFPHIVVRVRSAQDVSACLKFAKQYNIKASVASGAHSVMCFVDGALTIDFAEMTQVEYDSQTEECWAQSGALVSGLDEVCVKNNRVVPAGTNGDTGVAGLTLSGGSGWLCRKHGLTVDNLVGIDVVLADGTVYENVRDSSSAEQREILWGCRGSGGHFGVVTRFIYKTHPVPNNNQVLFGEVWAMCPTKGYKVSSVLNWWDKAQNLSDDSTSTLILPAAAPAVVLMWMHVGEKATPETLKSKGGYKEIEELSKAAEMGGLTNAKNSWKIIDYPQAQRQISEHQVHGFVHQAFLQVMEVNEDIAAVMVDLISNAPSKGTNAIIMTMGGAVQRTDPSHEKCSYSTRQAKAWILLESRWDPESDGYTTGSAKAAAWVKSFVEQINARCPGAVAKTTHALTDARYENAGDGTDALVDATNTSVAEKLRALKARVDPSNMLSHNRNLSTKAQSVEP